MLAYPVPRVAYSMAQKAEAIALASVIGADAAAAQLGMGARAIRGWMERAGKRPADAIEADQWRSLMDLALARVSAEVASGRMRVRDVAVVAGIAARNVRDPKVSSPDASVAVRDAFCDWLTERVLPEAVDEPTTEALVAAVSEVQPRLLLRRANAEPEQPHRVAILAWFSGRDDRPAGDVLEWAMAQVEDAIATHGSLIAWRAWQDAQDADDQRRLEEQLQTNRLARDAALASAREAMLDAETRSLLAAAEAYLRSDQSEVSQP